MSLLPDIRYGFMNTRAPQLYQESDYLKEHASFIEIQVHDKLKSKNNLLNLYNVSPNFLGCITIHGEGETDGKKRILFCSDDKDRTKHYIKESVTLYASIMQYLYPHKVNRLIVHPDTLAKKIPRRKQIQHLAESLVKLSENLDGIDVCIEPRGGDRQGKVLRTELEDLRILEEYITSTGTQVGLCVDIAQLFVVHGNNGMRKFLEQLRTLRLPVKEFHISDVQQTKKITNRVAMEIGTGVIDWKLILTSVLQRCNELLIETLGGIKIFERSKSYLESLVKKHEVLL